jgi:hypothetical protein
MVFNRELNDVQDKFFTVFIYVSYFLIIVSFFGFSNTAPKFLETLDYYVRIYICLFLIWRFNPFRNDTKFTNLDKKIAFSAGLFIITTTALNQYLVSIQDKAKNILNNIL